MNSIDRYLNKIPEPQKTTLMHLRKNISEVLPECTECISYGIPAFKYNETIIGGFRAGKKYCSYYPFSGSTLNTVKKALAKFEQTKSALHFPIDKPLSKKLIMLLILTRIAEIQTQKKKSKKIKLGGVEQYINKCPKKVQNQLRAIRTAIREVSPNSIETVSYFNLPGYSIEGFDYNGMFVWFSYKSPFVRLHVRPEALVNYKNELKNYTQSKAIICFHADVPIPKKLIKKLVKSSLKVMFIKKRQI